MDSPKFDADAAEAAPATDVENRRLLFLRLAEEIRPALHRYCARMCGSVADGEDIVQEVLVKAYARHAELETGAALRPWIFRIAHNRAIDWTRAYGKRMGDRLEEGIEMADRGTPDPGSGLAREETLRMSLSRFVELPASQRGAVILKDVLDYSLEEIATILESSVPAVKAALHRGRGRLREIGRHADPSTPPREPSPTLLRYLALFNAQDWDGVRAMLAEEVKLDLVSREKQSGRAKVAHYFRNYATAADWHFLPAWLDGEEVIAVSGRDGDPAPRYFIRIGVADGKVSSIQDFRYVPYILRDARLLS
ncbi:MAG: sigma-70 family RNA polymerase sigma factor [Fibrobacteria bacterium]